MIVLQKNVFKTWKQMQRFLSKTKAYDSYLYKRGVSCLEKCRVWALEGTDYLFQASFISLTRVEKSVKFFVKKLQSFFIAFKTAFARISHFWRSETIHFIRLFRLTSRSVCILCLVKVWIHLDRN